MNWKLIDQWSVFFAGRLVSNCSNVEAIPTVARREKGEEKNN
jgi:hypothetical protein